MFKIRQILEILCHYRYVCYLSIRKTFYGLSSFMNSLLLRNSNIRGWWCRQSLLNISSQVSSSSWLNRLFILFLLIQQKKCCANPYHCSYTPCIISIFCVQLHCTCACAIHSNRMYSSITADVAAVREICADSSAGKTIFFFISIMIKNKPSPSIPTHFSFFGDSLQ